MVLKKIIATPFQNLICKSTDFMNLYLIELHLNLIYMKNKEHKNIAVQNMIFTNIKE